MNQNAGPAARGARKSVRIARAQHRDHRLTTQRMRSTVADGRSLRQPFHESDARVKAEYGFSPDLSEERMTVRKNAELEQADSNGVEGARAGQCFHPGTVVRVYEHRAR